MIIESVCVGQMQVNCYILASAENRRALIIDPGDDEDRINKVLNKHKLKAAFIINTHGHIDHIGCDDKFGVPVYIHQRDSVLLKNPELNMSVLLSNSFRVNTKIKALNEKDVLELDDIKLEIIHMPGHTPGGIALLLKAPENRVVFTGDSLFYHGIGRTDFPGADENQLLSSIKNKLFKLSEDTVIYPGHGPSSTIGEEKKNNPFF